MKQIKGALLSMIFILTLVACSKTPSKESSINSNLPTSSEDIISTSEEASSSRERPSRPHTHTYDDGTVVEEATFFKTGVMRYQCTMCDESYEETYHKLDEMRFESETYQYDGQMHELLINGLIPNTVSVVYENNKQTEIGTKVATAKIYDEQNKLIKSLEAQISVASYLGLPKINVNTNSQPIVSKETYTSATVSISNVTEEKYIINDVSAGIRLRGNGTLEADKKPYRLKFNKKINLLGLNDGAQAKSWVLLADYYDYSMERNLTAFKIGNDLYNYSNNYTSDGTHVSLYINNIYNGIYLLAEQQQANANRVNIHEPNEDEYDEKVGYLLELDAYAPGEGEYFKVGTAGDKIGAISIPVRDYAIKSDYFSNKQFDYINKYVNNVHKIFLNAINGTYQTLDENNNIVASNYDNAFDTINAVVDVESLMKMYYLEEIMKDIDVGWSSFYLFVDFAEGSLYPRLTFGAPWDFDWSSGNVKDSAGSYLGTYNNTVFDHANPWLLMLSKTDFFNDYASQYCTLFKNSKIVDKAIQNNNYVTNCFANEFKNNFIKWPILGTTRHTYHPDVVTTFTTHADAANYFNNWLTSRINEINTIYIKEGNIV